MMPLRALSNRFSRLLWWGPVLALLVGGCLFEPRDPEPPSTGDSIPYLPRTEVKNVWTNLELALRNTDTFGWEENISPDFTYIPDGDTVSELGPIFGDWNVERERIFIANFFDSGVTIEAKMRDDEFEIPDDGGASEVPWEGVIYYLEVTSTAEGSTTRYRCSAKITFRLEGNFWYVYQWEDQTRQSDPDNVDQQLPSMGVLRGNFGS